MGRSEGAVAAVPWLAPRRAAGGRRGGGSNDRPLLGVLISKRTNCGGSLVPRKFYIINSTRSELMDFFGRAVNPLWGQDSRLVRRSCCQLKSSLWRHSIQVKMYPLVQCTFRTLNECMNEGVYELKECTTCSSGSNRIRNVSRSEKLLESIKPFLTETLLTLIRSSRGGVGRPF